MLKYCDIKPLVGAESLGGGDKRTDITAMMIPIITNDDGMAMVAPIDAQTSRCRHIVIQDQPPDRVPEMSHLVRSHFHHQSL
uniref:Uncharacterized protein n=1 Tax=Angiostrongylus cantonensis TaxID=6313 RepID=A0A0K0DR44_ANGCA